MTEYKIKFQKADSQTDYFVTYVSETELELELKKILDNGALIECISDKPEGQRDFYETNKYILLKKFNLLEQQEDNEDKIYEGWGL